MSPEFNLIKLEYVQWNDTETMQLKYTTKQVSEGKVFTLQYLHLTTIIDGKQYSLVFTSLKATYDSYVQTAEKIMYSLKVKKPVESKSTKLFHFFTPVRV